MLFYKDNFKNHENILMDKLKSELNALLDEALKTRHGVESLKKMAIDNRMYELGAMLRDYEKETFTEYKREIEEAERVRTLFGMMDISVNNKAAYIIFEAIKAYIEKGQNTDLFTSTKIINKADKIFGVWRKKG